MHSSTLVLSALVLVQAVNTMDISENVFGKNRAVLPVAFGDFNSDELTDVFVTHNSSRTLQILLANEKEPLLRPSPELTCHFETFRITSVVPGDFDGDAFMDILISTQNITDDPSSVYQDIRIIWGGDDKLNCTLEDLPIIIQMKGQPLAMDYNGDMIIDLFGINLTDISTFWVFNHNRTVPVDIPLSTMGNHKVRLPHSNAFLDLDGDFVSDLIISTGSSFEFWQGNKFTNGFTYFNKTEIPIGFQGHIGQSLYLDVELSGRLYLLVPICYDRQCVNSSIILNCNGVWITLSILFEEVSNKIWGFNPPNGDIYQDTITMRAGDYNMDGYPDLLVTLRQSPSTEPQAFLMENVPCDSCTNNFGRTFKIIWKALGPFEKGTIVAVFYDFYQDGVLDFILVQHNSTTNKYRIGAYKNTLENDANFMKVMVLTGLKNVKVPMTVGVLGKKKGTYGTNLPGPRISYQTKTQDGLPREGVCTQLPQSAYNALNLPFSIFGLDRTPNFVDTLTVGLVKHTKKWTQLIPNSQVVVIPHPPDDPSQWKAQLFVRPSKNVLKSVYVFTGICGLVALIVIFLHYKEKRDDRIEALSSENINEREVPS